MPAPLRSIMDIRRRELPLALLMFAYFFMVITTFWILKPLKKTLFVGYYEIPEIQATEAPGEPVPVDAGTEEEADEAAGGDQPAEPPEEAAAWVPPSSGEPFHLAGLEMSGAQAEQLAKVLNMLIAIVAVAVFSWLAGHLRRQQLTYVFSGFFIVAFALYVPLISGAGDATVWSFYFLGDLYSTLMVATFFAFLNDSVTPDGARRLYGLVGLGGVTGGVFGATLVRSRIEHFAFSTWLLTCIGLAVAIALVAGLAARQIGRAGLAPERARELREREAATDDGVPALQGARLVLRSRYLLAIVAIVGLYEICSTIMDFQFTATVEHLVSQERLGEHFSTIYMITNITSMAVQLFLTSLIMRRFGLVVALMVLPVMMMLGSLGFLLVPVLWTGSLLNTADNGFSYSINQSAKEALYVPTSRDEKYKAKAFIDMFVQRFAKAIAVGANIGISTWAASFEGLRWLSLLTLAILVAWMFAARYAGRHFEAVSG